ncbi:MAG: deoxyribodipyrimidine photo-lyase [Oscillatoriophycideae cyanobacterium NC_groundwater_1537_Pr4_S-0.65um_50_18]|nr:deoxyribodipyrimidine photo-lyase [Oscillatoriophycideae cyanobacterium NC_groundwater_1537_Pr4_S-0.65um_50_18]
MADLILFWHRRDLRTIDNVGLASAREKTSKVVGVFCLDPGILASDDVAPARVTYLIGSLKALQEQYLQAGSQLLILKGSPLQKLPELAQALQAKAVFWNRDVEPYGRSRDRSVGEALQQAGIEVETFWDQLLHAPKQILTGAGEPYSVYTPFWRNWLSKAKPSPAQDFAGAEGLTEQEQTIAQKAGAIELPTAKALGFVWENELLLPPGTQAAQERLAEFCDRALNDYQEQRNFPATIGTSHLSAALKFGTIGIRTVWQSAQAVYDDSRSDEARSNIQTWQQELAWREFYQQALYFFPQLAEGPYRQPFKNFPWSDRADHFQAWCDGQTGYPIVDAAMRQLNELGWMHNRCRMIVASFLTKDLIINWQWGEKYFMQKLFDGDLSANNGGWQWSASSGMDPKPLRIFNPASQAQKFDADGEYIRQWLPELRHLDTADLVAGKIDPGDCDRCGYPEPIVDHKKQQALFKQIYQQQKLQ